MLARPRLTAAVRLSVENGEFALKKQGEAPKTGAKA